MSSLSMPSSKKEKHFANSRARRHSNGVVVSQVKKSKKGKDTDTESITSSTASSAETAVSSTEVRKCPLRFMFAGVMETKSEETYKGGCPLRRVQLWHTIPLCLLAIVNLLLVILALLGLAGYRIMVGVQAFVITIVNPQPAITFNTGKVSEKGEVAILATKGV